MIDLLRCIVGDFEVVSKLRKFNKISKDIDSITALCKTRNWNILINAHSLTPSNFSISINSGVEVFELLPIEKYTLYKGMEVIPPSEENPIRQYLPKKIYGSYEDTFKTRF